MSGGGKSGGGGGSTTRDYYGSFAGILGWGPAEELVAIISDDKEIWRGDPPVKRSESANPYVLDIAGYGRIHFYWGTDDQVLNDPVLVGRDHPPYRRRVFMVFDDFLFGRERTSVPEVKVVWRRRAQQSVIDPLELDEDGQCNPLEFVLEVLTDGVNGLGLEPELFSAPSWEAMAAKLELEAATTYLSPGIQQHISGQRLLIEVLNYFGGWVRTNAAGEIEVGRWRDAPAGPLKVVTMADLVAGSRPSIPAQTTRDAATGVTVTFVDPDQAFQDDQVRFSNAARRGELDREDRVEIQRPWIRRGSQAGTAAAEAGEILAQPEVVMSMELLETRAVGLEPGERFIFRREDLEWEAVFRVIGRSGDGDGGLGVQIRAEKERILSAGIYPGGPSNTTIEAPDDLDELAYWQPLQLPASLVEGMLYKFTFLAGRTQGLVTEGRAYLQAEEAVEYQLLGVQRFWSVAFKVTAAYAATVPEDDQSGTLRLDLQPGALDFDLLDAAPTLDEIADDAWLIAIFPAANPENFELLTLRAFTPSVDGYAFSVWRARFGTIRRDFAVDDKAFIFRRSDLQWFGWGGLEARAKSGSPSVLTKFVPASASSQFAVADAAATTFVLRDQTGEDSTAALEAGQTALQQETADLNDLAADLEARVAALEASGDP